MARRIRVGDNVQVISGSDRGRQGKVLAIDGDRVRVEKVRIQKVHMKPGRSAARAGGILEREGFIHASNVMPVDGDGKPSRVRVQTDDKGRRSRVFATSGDAVPEPTEA
ncbi:MAG: 50S ribosomal protein L24 [Myxococcota bacterium]